ncbi:MAG: type II secretion system protein [Phycisphaerales bacterium]
MRRWTDTTRRGFTLIELIVAVGAFAIVAVSVATIFSSVGDTISAGKRQSRLNQLTAQIERVMRRDFERMTRDGFLVIRNEWAINVDGAVADADGDGYTDRLNVSNFPGDANPRPRRVDQIMFFARGDFESARAPVQPGFIASASEARIWYGHGQRKYDDGDPLTDEDSNYPGTYESPRLDDTMQGYGIAGKAAVDRLGYNPEVPGLINPNRYAVDWSLLRHVTLLIPPADPLAQALPDFGADGLYGYPVNRSDDQNGLRTGVTDGEFQVALQPAVSSIFWAAQQLNPLIGQTGDPALPGYLREYDPLQNRTYQATGNQFARVVDIAYDDLTLAISPTPAGLPEVAAARTSSGLVDIATTSLAEIEAIVTGADFNVNQTSEGSGGFGIENFEEFEFVLSQPRSGLYFPNTFARDNKPWHMMVNALPVAPDSTASLGAAGPHSDEVLAETFISGAGVAQAHRNRTSARIRYEPSPTNPLAGSDIDTSDPTDIIRAIYDQADQEILTRWEFVPRCTEFIVEWTYGWVFDDTHGSSSPYYVTPGDPRYKQTVWFGRERYTIDTNGDGRIVAGEDRPTVLWYQPRGGTPDPGNADPENPNRGIIVGQGALDASTPPPAELETAVFGYVRGIPEGAVPPTGNGGGFSPIPWKWPTQIRVTMSLADAADPSIESTIEVIFDVPSDDRGAF